MNTPSPTQSFYRASGTLPFGYPSYIRRGADDELIRCIQARTFCYILTPRQTGKSSLMINTALRLGKRNIRSVVIDLTAIGTSEIDKWYMGLLTKLKEQLQLKVAPEAWWEEHEALGPVACFIGFLRQVALEQIAEPIAIFIDEIDSTIRLPFRDEFFAAIRSMFEARSRDSAYERLTFVLLGVATPNDLMQQPENRPFDIGQAIDLRDFTPEEAKPLRAGLDHAGGDKTGPVWERILHWTGGHPYLTQKLCELMLKVPLQAWNANGVDGEVTKLVSGKPHPEINLQTVQDYVTGNPQRANMLAMYKKVLKGRRVPENQRSTEQNYLKLYGLVRVENGCLRVRNELYRRAFDDKWISSNMPTNPKPRKGAVVAVVAVALIAIMLFTAGISVGRWIEGGVASLRFGAATRQDRFGILARLFELGQDQAAREAFNSLGQDEKLALFKLPTEQTSSKSLVRVINGLYAEMPNDAGSNALLSEMEVSLGQLEDPDARLLHNEIKLWLAGRESFNSGAYAQAVTSYSSAILDFNSRNPGVYLDRALAYARLNQPEFALNDLLTVLTLNPSQAGRDRVRQVLKDNAALADVVRSQRDRYPALAPLAP